MALTTKGGAYESPGSRNYQPSWKKTDHLLLKWQNSFQCSSTDLEWFFLVKNITKSVKQWIDLKLGMILLQKERSLHWSKEMITVFQRALFFLVHKFLLSDIHHKWWEAIQDLFPEDIVNRYTSLWIGKKVIWHTVRVWEFWNKYNFLIIQKDRDIINDISNKVFWKEALFLN